MRKQAREWLNLVMAERIPGHSVAAMRICLGLLWAYELAWAILFQDAIYFFPYRAILLFACFLSALSLGIGWHTRLSALCNLVCTSSIIVMGDVKYHIDYFAQIAAFHFCFIDGGACWSVDAWRAKRNRQANIDGFIWRLPVLVFMFHVGTIYLDAAFAHLLYNQSWREGYAISQSFLHPQLAASWSFLFAPIPYVWTFSCYVTLFVEGLFVFILVPFLQNRNRQFVATTLGLAGFGLHMGISMTLNIGGFGPYPAGFLIAFLPPAVFDKLCSKHRLGWRDFVAPVPIRTDAFQFHRSERLFLLFMPLLLLTMVVRQVPVQTFVARSGQTQLQTAYGLLSFSTAVVTGDYRPHNVFAELTTSEVHAITAIARNQAGQPQTLPLLYDASGRRIGFGTHMRLYMHWLLYVTPKFPQADASPNAVSRWRELFEKSMSPLVRRYVSHNAFQSIEAIEFYYQERSVPQSVFTVDDQQAWRTTKFATVYLQHAHEQLEMHYDYRDGPLTNGNSND